MKRQLLLIPMAMVPVSVFAADHFFIIGGGPDPAASEAQIEFNVNWVIESVRQIVPDAHMSVFFANGTGTEKTAVALQPRGDSAVPLDGIASVYGYDVDNRLTYRRHQLANLDGSTRAESLVPELRKRLTALKSGDQAMIVYNGHGSWEPDRANNALRLWDGSKLTVREFEKVLSAVDSAVPVRYVFTQCFSGSFARAAHSDAEHALELARGQRCGFLAESSERESEGCSASVELGDYRDYTTFFFAGLTGKDRLGQPVEKAQDFDGDGKVTPFDAHLYTLLQGYNGDLPRSTSEDYLERWEPWWARWVGTATVPMNVYGQLARDMARRNGLPEDGNALGAALKDRYATVTDSNNATLRAREELEALIEDSREEIRKRIELRWPELAHPYTAMYRRLMIDSADLIDGTVKRDSTYPSLQAQLAQATKLEIELVDLDRRISQLDKLRRTRMLARALDQLQRRGSSRHRGAYEQLRKCEALPLGQH